MTRRGKAKTPEQRAARVARSIGVPAAQITRGGLVVQGVSNRTDADQRHMVRSKQTETVRKLTRIDALLKAGTIERHQHAACEWYAAVHAMGYDTLGCTANYLGAGGGGSSAVGLLARYRDQAEAREDYAFARGGIDGDLLPLFEAAVLAGEALTKAGEGMFAALSVRHSARKAASLFGMAANQLHHRIAHLLPID